MTSKQTQIKIICAGMLSFTILFLGGCALMKDIRASHNRERLTELKIGMTREEVLEHKGKPWKTEAFVKDGDTYTVLYYVTQRIPDGATTDEEMTPVVFRGQSLIGWGRHFFSDLRIEIRQEHD